MSPLPAHSSKRLFGAKHSAPTTASNPRKLRRHKSVKLYTSSFGAEDTSDPDSSDDEAPRYKTYTLDDTDEDDDELSLRVHRAMELRRASGAASRLGNYAGAGDSDLDQPPAFLKPLMARENDSDLGAGDAVPLPLFHAITMRPNMRSFSYRRIGKLRGAYTRCLKSRRARFCGVGVEQWTVDVMAEIEEEMEIE